MDGVGVQHPQARVHRWLPWAGWIVSMAPVLIVLMSARWKLTLDPWYVREFTRIGWTVEWLPRLALLQLSFAALFLIPQTAVLGAVLLTGYLGGAIATYTRLGELTPPLVPLTTAVLAWLGLYLRDGRIRALLPLRRRER